MSDTFVTYAQEGEVILNNVPLKVNGDIIEELQNIFGRKTQQGDPGPDDHPINSTISQEENTGGMGTLKRRTDEDTGRYWFSTLWTQSRGVLALHPKTQIITVSGITNEPVWPLGMYGGNMHIAFGQKLKIWNELTDAADNPGATINLTNAAVGRGIAWGNATIIKKLYIPEGTTYETWDGTTLAAGVGSERAMSFVVWSQKLFKLDDNGVVKVTVDNVSWTTVGRITDDFTPHRLFIWKGPDGRDAVHVSTSGKVYYLDYTNSELVETDFEYPDHPDQGMAATTWRNDAYVSVGAGVHQDQGGFVTAVGLDGRDGLPQEYAQGRIKDAQPSYNELLVAYEGSVIVSPPAPETADQGVNQPEAMYAQAFPRRSFVAGNNVLGWSVKSVMEDTLTDIAVGSNHAEGVYRWYVGGAGRLYTQIMPTGYWNPRINDTALIPLERYGYHMTPFYNWGWLDTPKILKQLEMKVSKANANDRIVVWLRKDEDDMWGNGIDDGTPLATITSNGQFVFSTGQSLIGDRLFFTGMEHEQVQFLFEEYGDPASNYTSPNIEWYALIGRKWMRPVRVWTFQVDGTQPLKGMSETAARSIIFDAATKKGGVTLVIGDQIYVVDVTSDVSNREAGISEDGYINVTCVEWSEALLG